jgi:hypothetical protein
MFKKFSNIQLLILLIMLGLAIVGIKYLDLGRTEKNFGVNQYKFDPEKVTQLFIYPQLSNDSLIFRFILSGIKQNILCRF